MKKQGYLVLVLAVVFLTGCSTVTDQLTKTEEKVDKYETVYVEDIRQGAIDTVKRVEREYDTVITRVKDYHRAYCGSDVEWGVDEEGELLDQCMPSVEGDGIQASVLARWDNYTDNTKQELAKADKEVRELFEVLQKKDAQVRKDWQEFKTILKDHDVQIKEYFEVVNAAIDTSHGVTQRAKVAIDTIIEVVRIYAG